MHLRGDDGGEVRCIDDNFIMVLSKIDAAARLLATHDTRHPHTVIAAKAVTQESCRELGVSDDALGSPTFAHGRLGTFD